MFDPWYDVSTALPRALSILIAANSDAAKDALVEGEDASDFIFEADTASARLGVFTNDFEEEEQVTEDAREALFWVADHLNQINGIAELSEQYAQTLKHWSENANSHPPYIPFERWQEILSDYADKLFSFAAAPDDETAQKGAVEAYRWSGDKLTALWD